MQSVPPFYIYIRFARGALLSRGLLNEMIGTIIYWQLHVCQLKGRCKIIPPLCIHDSIYICCRTNVIFSDKINELTLREISLYTQVKNSNSIYDYLDHDISFTSESIALIYSQSTIWRAWSRSLRAVPTMARKDFAKGAWVEGDEERTR